MVKEVHQTERSKSQIPKVGQSNLPKKRTRPFGISIPAFLSEAQQVPAPGHNQKGKEMF